MSALSHLVNPPKPILLPGRVAGLGWSEEKIRRRADDAHAKGELARRILDCLADGPLSCLDIAMELDAERAAVNKALLRLTRRNAVVRLGQWGSYTFTLVEPRA